MHERKKGISLKIGPPLHSVFESYCLPHQIVFEVFIVEIAVTYAFLQKEECKQDTVDWFFSQLSVNRKFFPGVEPSLSHLLKIRACGSNFLEKSDSDRCGNEYR